jgi:RimJ/RimL family protein N-acetyltransferase
LYEWRNEEAFVAFCTHRPRALSFESFVQELGQDFTDDRDAQWIIRRRRTREPLGTLWLYDLSRRDGFAFLSVYVAPRCRGRGVGPEAVALVLQYILGDLCLHKIYADVYAQNLASVSCLQGDFVLEGTFRGHRLVGGNRLDVLRFAAHRDAALPRIVELGASFGYTTQKAEVSHDP